MVFLAVTSQSMLKAHQVLKDYVILHMYTQNIIYFGKSF